MCMVHDMLPDLSPLATAYARARGQRRTVDQLSFDVFARSRLNSFFVRRLGQDVVVWRLHRSVRRV